MYNRKINLCTILLLFLCHCGGEESPQPGSAGTLKLKFSGQEVVLPLEAMDVYLTEAEDRYPEMFEMSGPDVTLVGAFPMDLHVGYGEDWNLMVERSIPIEASGGARGRDKLSTITVNGVAWAVQGGSFIVQKVKEDRLKGIISLTLGGAGGETEAEGEFEVEGNTWG